jgi:hypothetical protein
MERMYKSNCGGERDFMGIQVRPGGVSSRRRIRMGRYSLVFMWDFVASIILRVGMPWSLGRGVVDSRSAKYLGGSIVPS